MKVLLILVGFLTGMSSFAQPHKEDYLPIQSTDPAEPLDDIFFLSDYLHAVKLVGMGESTHGTHEFFKMRSKVFQFLVRHHGFNTFFLEADYASCLDIDRYIKGGMGNAEQVVSKIDLWPWETQEMVTLMEWMRDYTVENPDTELSFIGCDLQKYDATVHKIDSLITIYAPESAPLSSKYKNTDQLQPKIVLEQSSAALNTGDFSSRDKLVYETLLRHLGQIIYENSEASFFSFRDIQMAENILYHFDQQPSTKGFFWAHNLHVFTIFNEHKKKEKAYKRAGGVLSRELGNKYFVIAQEFDEGAFSAYRIKADNLDADDKNNYQLGPVVVEPSVSGSFGYHYRNTKDAILFIKPEALKKKQVKYLKMHDIGATFLASAKNPNQAARFSSCNGCFDAMILIKKTTATTLLASGD